MPCLAGKLGPGEYIEQGGAHVPAGGDIGLYVVGSSNVLWMTWVDQLHLSLARLGYRMHAVPVAMEHARYHPTSVQRCDDTRYFNDLMTARLGWIGWNSWDFAFDDWSDCDEDGFRRIGGYRVKCAHGEGCSKGKKPFFKLSDIAEDASKSNVTVISTWFNDHKQFQSDFACLGGERIIRENTSFLAIPTLLKTVRAIHKRSPDVWILVLGEYPPTNISRMVVEDTLPWLRVLNRRVKDALEEEPRTVFVDYEMPAGGLEMYQIPHWGHPNCRGSKLIAHAVIDKLYRWRVLARSINLVDPLRNTANPNCTALNSVVCHTSVLCWLDPADGLCKPYSAGSRHFYKHTSTIRSA